MQFLTFPNTQIFNKKVVLNVLDANEPKKFDGKIHILYL